MGLQNLRKIDKCLRTFRIIFAVVDFSHIFLLPVNWMDCHLTSNGWRWWPAFLILKIISVFLQTVSKFCWMGMVGFSTLVFEVLYLYLKWIEQVLHIALFHKKLQNSKICPKALLRTIPFTICFCWRKNYLQMIIFSYFFLFLGGTVKRFEGLWMKNSISRC